jgi:hypothetical protein
MLIAFTVFSFKPICKSKAFVNYKRTISVESKITHLLFKVHTLFALKKPIGVWRFKPGRTYVPQSNKKIFIPQSMRHQGQKC